MGENIKHMAKTEPSRAGQGRAGPESPREQVRVLTQVQVCCKVLASDNKY